MVCFDPQLLAYEDGWGASNSEAIVAGWRTLPQPPTAVFCASDAIALGLLAAAEKAGWRVPQELSIVGVDNSMAGADAVPSLTSVQVPVEEIGRTSVQVLMNLMTGAPDKDCRIAVRVNLIVVRDSTAPTPVFAL